MAPNTHLTARQLPGRSPAEADRPDWSEAPEIAVLGLDRPRRSRPDRRYPTGDNRTKNPDPGNPYSAGWLPRIRPLTRAPDTLIHTVIHTVRRPCGERTSGQP